MSERTPEKQAARLEPKRVPASPVAAFVPDPRGGGICDWRKGPYHPSSVERSPKLVSFPDQITDRDDVQFVNPAGYEPPLPSQPTLGEDEYSEYEGLAVQDRYRGREVPPQARVQMRP